MIYKCPICQKIPCKCTPHVTGVGGGICLLCGKSHSQGSPCPKPPEPKK